MPVFDPVDPNRKFTAAQVYEIMTVTRHGQLSRLIETYRLTGGAGAHHSQVAELRRRLHLLMDMRRALPHVFLEDDGVPYWARMQVLHGQSKPRKVARHATS